MFQKVLNDHLHKKELYAIRRRRYNMIFEFSHIKNIIFILTNILFCNFIYKFA